MSRPLAPTSSLLAPRYWPIHLLALVCTALAAAMGVWQYDAWQTRRAEAAVDLTDAAPAPVTDLIGPDDPFPADAVGRPAEVAGSWLPESTYFVSGRESGGRDGYWVVTPLEIEATGSALLVVRGWTAEIDSAPEPPTGSAEITGWLQPGEGSTEPDPDRTDDVVPQLRVAEAAQRVTQDLYGAYAVVDSDRDHVNAGTDGLEPATLDQLPPVGAFTSIRNLLYALEWWVFALFAIYAWWRWVRDVREEGADSEGADLPANRDSIA